MRVIYGLTLAVTATICLPGVAQERREVPREAPGTPAVRREAAQPAGTADQQIAAVLSVCARNEVEISKFAQDKATSEAVREFAEMMVKDHTPGLEKLQRLAGPLAAAHAPGTPAAAVRKEVVREVEPQAKIVKEETVVEIRPAGQGLNWVAIHRQIADQCLASTKAEFGKKEGEEFDHCYMGQQIMAHAKALDELKVLRNYASAELRKEIDQTSEMAAQHLDQAKKIAESMKAEGTERVSRKPKAP